LINCTLSQADIRFVKKTNRNESWDWSAWIAGKQDRGFEKYKVSLRRKMKILVIKNTKPLAFKSCRCPAPKSQVAHTQIVQVARTQIVQVART
jgi:hypothetical protein